MIYASSRQVKGCEAALAVAVLLVALLLAIYPAVLAPLGRTDDHLFLELRADRERLWETLRDVFRYREIVPGRFFPLHTLIRCGLVSLFSGVNPSAFSFALHLFALGCGALSAALLYLSLRLLGVSRMISMPAVAYFLFVHAENWWQLGTAEKEGTSLALAGIVALILGVRSNSRITVATGVLLLWLSTLCKETFIAFFPAVIVLVICLGGHYARVGLGETAQRIQSQLWLAGALWLFSVLGVVIALASTGGTRYYEGTSARMPLQNLVSNLHALTRPYLFLYPALLFFAPRSPPWKRLAPVGTALFAAVLGQAFVHIDTGIPPRGLLPSGILLALLTGVALEHGRRRMGPALLILLSMPLLLEGAFTVRQAAWAARYYAGGAHAFATLVDRVVERKPRTVGVLGDAYQVESVISLRSHLLARSSKPLLEFVTTPTTSVIGRSWLERWLGFCASRWDFSIWTLQDYVERGEVGDVVVVEADVADEQIRRIASKMRSPRRLDIPVSVEVLSFRQLRRVTIDFRGWTIIIGER